ncbi:MAG: hypothetical protein ACOX5T_08240 [Candidatus Cryptobacteroides sp.]|jgi:hypothetical protein
MSPEIDGQNVQTLYEKKSKILLLITAAEGSQYIIVTHSSTRALIDNLTVVQQVINGQIPSTFKLRTPENDKKRSFWINCKNALIKILLRMEEMAEGP